VLTLGPVARQLDLSNASVISSFVDDTTRAQGVFYSGAGGSFIDGPEGVCYQIVVAGVLTQGCWGELTVSANLAYERQHAVEGEPGLIYGVTHEPANVVTVDGVKAAQYDGGVWIAPVGFGQVELTIVTREGRSQSVTLDDMSIEDKPVDVLEPYSE
jgi:hypothetical protein